LNDRFVERWSTFNRSLDMGSLPETAPEIAKMAVSGPAPVDGPEGNRLLREALKEHEANSDIYKAARQVDFRDETAPAAGVPVDAFSPHAHSGTSVPLLVFGGWQDGVYADAALKRYMLLDTPQRLILGALNHAGTQDTDPWKPQDSEPDPSFEAQLLEMLRFFDHYLKARGPRPRPEIVFKLMGADRWLTARTWPPGKIETKSLALGADLGLGDAASQPGSVKFRPNLEFRTGARRWLTQLTRGDVYYKPEIWDQDGILAFTAEPLRQELTIMGSPVVSLKMTSSLPGAALHGYLLALGPEGEKICLTEGLFRLMHRGESSKAPPRFLGAPVHSFEKADAAPLLPRMPARVEFGLGSVATTVPAGYRLVLVLAGRDASQFARYPARGIPEFTFFTGLDESRLELPVTNLEKQEN
jgi:putative CocE/NonD family hydrolase